MCKISNVVGFILAFTFKISSSILKAIMNPTINLMLNQYSLVGAGDSNIRTLSSLELGSNN